MNSRRRVLAIVVITSLIGAGAMLAYWPQPPGGSTERGPAEKIKLALSTTFAGSALVFIADVRGYIREENLEIELLPHTSGQAALQTVLEGKADLATAADTPIMFAVMAGHPVSIVASIASEITDQGIVARTDRGIKSLRDLDGKRVGFTPRSSAQFMLDSVLLREGIPMDRIARVGLKPEQIATALAQGDIDAAATWSPWLERAQEAAGSHAVSFSGKRIHSYTFNLVGRRDTATARSRAILRLVSTLARAERFAAEHPQEAQAIVSEKTGMDPLEVARHWRSYAFRLSLDQTLLTLLEDESRWAIQNAYTTAANVPNYLQYIGPEAMLAVSPQAVNIIR